ncbi:porin family protein [Mesonia sp. K7]|uniref:type IX secretion/gliding motility protein PorT/SprT n=1 Tax=Mesonia sp. K7 TaxID=2218606 RepID=UPI000DA90A18|nr:porin family protein [Mesonia sp. K7]PZD77618.1 PorT family protein [Mesonia sp. K7]
MKKIVFILLLFVSFQNIEAQGIFSKEKIKNKENFDKQRWSWGYFLGFNSYDFKFEYEEHPTEDIIVEKSLGFNVGLLGNMRINDYIDLRLEPGVVFANRNITFPEVTERNFREVKSTYVHIPLLVKFSTKRLNNFKPFVVGGASYAINLSSNQDNPDDNTAGEFRMMNNAYFYEIGFGIDFYLPYFKFTPSIRGVFGLNDELKPDNEPGSIFTSNISQMQTRGIFINFTFQ